MICVRNIVKEYRIRESGNGIRDLLHPKYQNYRAVDDISFSIDAGEIVGLIGPNGAGKSTTIKMLTAILAPTSGEIIIDGEKPYANRKKYVKNIGAMFGQKTQLWWDLPLFDSFLLLKEIFDVDNNTFRKNMELFTDVLELDKFMKQPVRQLSLGQRVRGDLAAVLLHNPKVVFLDEPTIGLDFVVKKRIREFLKEINRVNHTTIVITSHDMDDIESLCERVYILNRGKIAYSGSLELLKRQYGEMRYMHVRFDEECIGYEVPGAQLMKCSGNENIYGFDYSISPAVLINYISANKSIQNISIVEPDIEELIGEIYRRGE